MLSKTNSRQIDVNLKAEYHLKQCFLTGGSRSVSSNVTFILKDMRDTLLTFLSVYVNKSLFSYRISSEHLG